jgi:hypothetical protein
LSPACGNRLHKEAGEKEAGEKEAGEKEAKEVGEVEDAKSQETHQ